MSEAQLQRIVATMMEVYRLRGAAAVGELLAECETLMRDHGMSEEALESVRYVRARVEEFDGSPVSGGAQ